MIIKGLKRAGVAVVVIVIAGGVISNTEMGSYVCSSFNKATSTLKGSIPIELELQRARDTLKQIIPEMHANIRLIAKEEVEIATLKKEIETGDSNLITVANNIQQMKQKLTNQHTSYKIGRYKYSREQIKSELERKFVTYKEAELVLQSKIRLLASREKAYQESMALLETTQSQKEILASQIEDLEARYRIQQSVGVGTIVEVDSSKLTQTEKIINEIRQRLETDERVLALEGRLVDMNPTNEEKSEGELLTEIDDYFSTEEGNEVIIAIEEEYESDGGLR